MWQTEGDVAMGDVTDDVGVTKWIMSHTMRETKTKKREVKKFKFKNLGSSISSCLSSQFLS